MKFTFTFTFNTILMYARGRNFVYALRKIWRRLRRFYATDKIFNSILRRTLVPNLTLIGAKQNVESTHRNVFSLKVQLGFRYADFV